VDKILNDSYYTLDKLVVEFCMRTEDAQRIMDKLGCMINVNPSRSNMRAVCHYQYNIDLDHGNSFWIGFEPNWKKFDGYVKYGRVEFNPAKVSEDLQFQSLYGELMSCVSCGFAKGVRFDLAIDMPIARDRVHMMWDNRLHGEIGLGLKDRTQYLGRKHNHGYIKLYNKALELGLKDMDLTRLELTVDYKTRSFENVQRIVPKMYIMDSFQLPLGINGTDKLLIIAVLSDFNLLKELPHTKRKKIEGYLANTLLSLELDIKKYNQVLDYINTFIK
jgi:hypothetical protein